MTLAFTDSENIGGFPATYHSDTIVMSWMWPVGDNDPLNTNDICHSLHLPLRVSIENQYQFIRLFLKKTVEISGPDEVLSSKEHVVVPWVLGEL